MNFFHVLHKLFFLNLQQYSGTFGRCTGFILKSQIEEILNDQVCHEITIFIKTNSSLS